MTRRPLDPQAIALWRYELIQEALDDALTRQERGRLLSRLSRAPVAWPGGGTKRVSRATLYRWIQAYRRAGLRGLRPKPRKDRGVVRQPLPEQVVARALALLRRDPTQSLTFLLAVLQAEFRPYGIRVPRTTLSRRLRAAPEYAQLKRAARQQRRRGRFVADAPHEIWQADAKGPFPVRLVSGETICVHVISILDDATRAILAARVVTTVDLAAAVTVFQDAARRWGIPEKLYADRASVFDSAAFRAGLAGLGSRRIWTRPRNAPARGKVEAYHRVLSLWFVDRLEAQQVHDLRHLQRLLTGMIEGLYQPHEHRGIKTPPAEALAGQTSPRVVPPAQLVEAFLSTKHKRAHPTTGEVELQGKTWLVPDALRQERGRLRFLLDPTASQPPLVCDPISEARHPLRRAAVKPGDVTQAPEPWGEGPLQTLYDEWRGQRRPLADPGFGLPELYRLLAEASGRVVPQREREAVLVQRWYRQHGPLPARACQRALAAIARELGAGRPLAAYLDALAPRIQAGDDS